MNRSHCHARASLGNSGTPQSRSVWASRGYQAGSGGSSSAVTGRRQRREESASSCSSCSDSSGSSDCSQCQEAESDQETRDQVDFQPAAKSGYHKKRITMSVPASSLRCDPDPAPSRPRRSRSPSPSRSPQPQYPTHHSFIVDMNNKPLYEGNSGRRVVVKSGHTPVRGTEVGGESLRRLEEAANANVQKGPPPTAYYPPKSPYGKHDRSQSENCGSSWKLQLVIVSLLVLFAFVFLFAILGTSVEMHQLVAQQKRALEELRVIIENEESNAI